MPIAALSKGAILDIANGVDVQSPILQVLGAKRIPPQDPELEERYRLLVSDGKYQHSFTMLATQLNHLYTNNLLTDFTIIRVDKYVTSLIQRKGPTNRKVIVLIDLVVLNKGEDVGQKIGDPVTIENVLGKEEPETKPNPSNVSEGMGIRTNATTSKRKTDDDIFADGLIHPINSLSPYQNRWIIKARVTAKSNIRSWSNAKGEGKLFSIDLKDETGEIRATAFKDAVDKFYDMIEVDSVYYISKCQLKTANKQYSALKNDYEITFTSDTQVRLCTEETTTIPTIQYNFIPISNIANMEPNAIIDVIGVVKSVGDMQHFTAKTSGKELMKREVTLVDTSNASVQLTLWGETAATFEQNDQPVILLKSARVAEFGGGKTIGLSASGSMKLNPTTEEAARLRHWFESGSAENITTSVSAKSAMGGTLSSEWVTFYEAKERGLGAGDKPDYFQCKALVHNIRTGNCIYKACPQSECNKKVIDQENGRYRCEKCNMEFSTFKYRLLMQMLIGDWTGNRYVTVFTETGEQLLGKTSKEVGEALESGGEEESIFQNVNFKSFIFKLRTKIEYYGDTPRNKITVVSASPINHKDYNGFLIKRLQELTGIGKI